MPKRSRSVGRGEGDDRLFPPPVVFLASELHRSDYLCIPPCIVRLIPSLFLYPRPPLTRFGGSGVPTEYHFSRFLCLGIKRVVRLNRVARHARVVLSDENARTCKTEGIYRIRSDFRCDHFCVFGASDVEILRLGKGDGHYATDRATMKLYGEIRALFSPLVVVAATPCTSRSFHRLSLRIVARPPE